jgi:hydroxyacylglutathione hydrolase
VAEAGETQSDPGAESTPKRRSAPQATKAKPADRTSKPKRTSAARKTKPTKRFQREESEPAQIVRAYMEAINARDLDAAVALWAAGAVDRIGPVGEFRAPDELRQFFAGLQAAIPDSRVEILDLIADGDHVAMRWRTTGTFCAAPFQGIEPTGAHIELEGIDLFTVGEGLIQENNAYYDGAEFARQAGLLPPRDSAADQRMTALLNTRTRFARRLFSTSKEPVAEGVWLVRGGFPLKTMNVYLIEDDGGVTVFDAGIRAMTKGVGSVAAPMGGIKRIVLGHEHADHRGAAPGLGAAVFCHPDAVADAEGDGGEHYFDFSKLERAFARITMPWLIRHWDGGPVRIEGTVKEGDEIAGFEVVHLPGHSPGLIGLWRESDRLALVSDTLYTLDPQTGRHGPPRVPHRAFNKDTEQARASIRKLASMEPAAVWPGHADPVLGDVRGQLERAADTT